MIRTPDITPASLMDDPADAPSLTEFAGLRLIDRTVIPHADGLLEPYPSSLIDEMIARYGGATGFCRCATTRRCSSTTIGRR